MFGSLSRQIMPRRKTNTLTKSHYETLASFRYALRRFLRFSEKAAEAERVTAQQHQALLAIKGFPGRGKVTISELAERLQLRHHSTVGLVDRLVKERWVVRGRSSEDRRQVFIELTPAGENLLGRLAHIHHEELQRVGPELIDLLHRLQNNAKTP